MPNLKAKFKVELTPEQRAELEALCRRQTIGAAKHRRAKILLMADENHPDGRRRDWEIAEAVGLCERQVVRIRQQFVREGDVVLSRRASPSRPSKLDGEAEAQLVTLCCSTPPKGRERWTLQLLCDELARLKVVTSVCRETVRKRLKKTCSSLGEWTGFASQKRIGRGLSREWNKSLTSTRRRTTNIIR